MECLPYTFEGKWTNEEKAAIEVVMRQHVPEVVDPMFNNWAFYVDYYSDGGYYSAKRATWDMGMLHARSANELATKLEDYYTR